MEAHTASIYFSYDLNEYILNSEPHCDPPALS